MTNKEQQDHEYIATKQSFKIQGALEDVEELLDVADEVLNGEAVDSENQNIQKVHTVLRSIKKLTTKMHDHNKVMRTSIKNLTPTKHRRSSHILNLLNVEDQNVATNQPSFKESSNVAIAEKIADPIITQARRLAALEKEHNRLGEQLVFSNSGHISQVRSTYYNDRMNEIDYEIDAVKLIIPFTKATELEGAAIQLALLCHLTDSLVYEKGYEAHRKRLLYSIMDVIMQNVSLRPEDVAIDKLMPMHLNPWVGIDEIVDKVEASLSHA